MNLSDKIIDIISDQGLNYTEKSRTIYTTCPECGRSDKLSILKENGATICYHGGCDFGKAWFQDWLALTAGISIQEAKKQIYGTTEKFTEKLEFDLGNKKKNLKEDLQSLEWPVPGFIAIDDPQAVEGSSYLENRGITTELAKHCGIMYSPWFRRVVLPINMNNECYGWQARAIDKVNDSERMRNNTGFRRESLLMFYDTLADNEIAMLFEGPFDALKFYSFGGIVCSMGKHISDKQVALINESGVKEVYLGLDPDATVELRELTRRIEKKIKILTIPESCNIRCKKLGKKPDFGECTFMEAKEAFDNAKDFSNGHVFMNLKKFF